MRNLFKALTLLAATLTLGIACDDNDQEKTELRSGNGLLPYATTRMANPIEGAGGELQMVQYVANGVSSDPASFTFINLGSPAACDGMDCTADTNFPCFGTVFNENQSTQESRLDAFIADSQTRFGVNITNPAKYFVFPYEAREDVGIRAVAMSGLPVPADGYKVNDCGWQAVVIDGSGDPSLNMGAYLIESENLLGPLPVRIDYRLKEPVFQLSGANGTPISLGRYIVNSPTYGDGLSEFVVASECDGTIDPNYFVCIGTTNHNIRNSITFSDRSGL